ncbi:T9SS type A sorting domain-containing protein [Flavobacterium soyangense]|uniref:T9SS type A sorting domain-containing protein n=1 Tax=Flavobacterium soyangense TaxID=2023265 RepID=A0A930XXQ0_9FLAO|nr:T9SS type A sorting domain-containing protein [Flavobacterium soyangense]MBF2707028.1 T9SS type A sorting domain-containing protein [Flavobacterium soyangense]
MKKIYILSMLLLAGFTSFSQIIATSYRGAFAPAPAALWTNSWTNFDPQNAVYPTPNVDVTANITVDTHWTAGNTYYLKGQTYVKNNATLTIDAGVVIRADHTATGAGLFVTKGAKVIAIGTATNPIVFTSDNAVGSRNKGDWGGVILLGKGSFNINNGVNNIEGIAASTDTEYGGGLSPDDNDNSGTLKYVRIEYAGYVYAANQEINGLTFGAVGRGTTIDYVQVSFANDDSFEWFGGTVNCKHIIAYRGLDDDFDTDNGYSGSVQFGLGIRDPQISDNPTVSTSEGFESDNNASSTAVSPYTGAIFTNMTLLGPSYRLTLPNGGTIASGYKRAARLRRNTQLKVYNSIFMDFQEGLHIDGVTTETNAINNTLKWKNNIMAGIVSKELQVNSPGTITAGVNPSFNMTTWYAANGNTTVSSNGGLLTKPYDLTDATIYTGLDYRPATGSIALTGADFTDASFTGNLQTTYYVDVDGDGYDSGTAVLAAATPPIGYSFTTNGPDCDDTNTAIQSNCPTITKVAYRGAFAPAPIPMWTDSWTNFDPQNAVYPTPNVDVTANITVDTHWTAGNTYYLKGQTYVKNNATLTIDAGVVIRADHTATGAGLFVTKGAKVIAIGTATNPIVFTSDNAVGSRNKGDWGGVILLGKGSFNINNGVNNIEGIAASTDTEYGGGLSPDDNDNSGTLKYVRIEYAGYVYAANQEINGLTFGAVGRGTTIDYVQVSFANDDSFEWFGGTVNCKHIIAYRGLDDDFDTDNGYSGSVQFGLGIRDPQISDNPTVSTSEGFESDNNASSTAVSPYTGAIFTNMTLLGPSYRLTLPNGGTIASGYKRAARLRRNTQLKVYNSIFMDFQEGLHIDGVTTETNAINNTLKWKNNIMAGIVSKELQVNSPGTITAGVNPSFNMTTWYAANGNTTVSSNGGLLTKPYDLTDATIYTGLDYRPATGSIALTGADFTDASLGTDNFIASSEFSLVVYPNPSANSFKINYFSPSDENVKVATYDLTGKLLESLSVNYTNINNQEIGNGYAPGVYIIVLKQGNISKSVRVIKD